MLQMADARTSGTAVTRIFSVLEVNGRDENKAFDYMKKLRPNVQLYTKSGGGGTLPVGLGQAGGGIFFIVDALDTQAKGYDVTISFPKEGIGTAAEGIALIKGAKNPALGKKLIDWATSPAMQNQFAKYKINFVPAHPDVAVEPSLAAVLKGANIFAIDAAYAGANRKKDRRSLGRRSAEPVALPMRELPPSTAAGLRRDPAVSLTVLVLWLLLGLFVVYPLAALFARVLFDHGRFTPGGHRRDPRRPAPVPRVRQQPVARSWRRDRRHAGRISVRIHGIARQAEPRTADHARCRGAAAARVAAVHVGDRDDLLVRAARPHHLRAARVEGRHRLWSDKHTVLPK